eukprot:g11352.t1
MAGLGLHTDSAGYAFGDDDSLWEMAEETKKLGNKYFTETRYADAIQRYSEVIMQCRQMQPHVVKKEESEIRVLIQSCYLNLSMCFLKSGQWTHAYNAAHRALQGDQDPPNPKHDVLSAAQKAKALFRKCTAALSVLDGITVEGHVGESAENLGTAQRVNPTLEKIDADITKALGFEPKDVELLKMQRVVRKRFQEEKQQEKARMKGFLASDKGAKAISGNEERKRDGPPAELDPEKLKAANLGVDNVENVGEDADQFTEMIGELNEMIQEDPEQFEKIKAKIKAKCEANNALPADFLEKIPEGGAEEGATMEEEEPTRAPS